MSRISTTFQISLSLACLVIGILFAAQLLGIIPDSHSDRLRSRVELSELIAIEASLAIQHGDPSLLEQTLEGVVQRNSEIIHVRLTRIGGEEVAAFRAPAARSGIRPEPSLISVPVSADGEPWGAVELGMEPLAGDGVWGIVTGNLARLLIFTATLGVVVFFTYLRRVLRRLDASEVVPERVRTTLDALAEGLVVLDNSQRIVLANSTFANTVGADPADLFGKNVAEFGWRFEDEVLTPDELPWSMSMKRGKSLVGQLLKLADDNGADRTFRVNASPILDEKGACQGAFASFDDVTVLEERNASLKAMLQRLRESRDQIRRQNGKLQVLATQDPLTNALNRRSFFEQFERLWFAAQRNHKPLSCIMVDIDHFKSINDNHGHAAGDAVLKRVVQAIKRTKRQGDLICRYGGEEFCVLLIDQPLTDAVEMANRLRIAIASEDYGGIRVTASFGISASSLDAGSADELLNQADQALYDAKRSGRNRTVQWEKMTPHVASDSNVQQQVARPGHETRESPISFQTVTALLSALAYRDAATAEHSRRVADYCVSVAQGLMSLSECYILENAALLHDIGKIGVPDSILLKPGPLDEEEWKIIRTHDRISVEIIRSTFACDELTQIVTCHHTHFDAQNTEASTGTAAPLGARILAVADAYDAMTTDRVFRRAGSQASAFAELRRCSGQQFDPQLVERFIEIVGKGGRSHQAELQHVNKRTALLLGIQLENMARALDQRDTAALANLAQQVRETASNCRITEIAELARVLEESAANDDEWMNNVQLTIDLMDLCRMTQRSHLSTKEQADVPRLPNANRLTSSRAAT